jgi:hypothetical protein
VEKGRGNHTRRFDVMAITAWSAKVVTSSICLSVNGWGIVRMSEKAPNGAPSRSNGNRENEIASFQGLRHGNQSRPKTTLAHWVRKATG